MVYLTFASWNILKQNTVKFFKIVLYFPISIRHPSFHLFLTPSILSNIPINSHISIRIDKRTSRKSNSYSHISRKKLHILYFFYFCSQSSWRISNSLQMRVEIVFRIHKTVSDVSRTFSYIYSSIKVMSSSRVLQLRNYYRYYITLG